MNKTLKELEKIQKELLSKKKRKIPKDESDLVETLIEKATDVLLKDWQNEVILQSINELDISLFVKCKVYARLYKIQAPPPKFVSEWQEQHSPMNLSQQLDIRFCSLIEPLFEKQTANLDLADKIRFLKKSVAGNSLETQLLGFTFESEEGLADVEEKFYFCINSIRSKLENEIKELETLSEQKMLIKSKDEKTVQRHKDMSLYRAVLFYYYWFKYSKVDCPNTKKAEIVSFLTGFSPNTIREKFSNIFSKADENFPAFEKDMQIVRKQFQNLDLIEVTKMIDNDLEDIKSKL